MYSSTSKATLEFCARAGFMQSINFVETRKTRGEIYVRGTCGKKHEFLTLQAACARLGAPYRYCPKQAAWLATV